MPVDTRLPPALDSGLRRNDGGEGVGAMKIANDRSATGNEQQGGPPQWAVFIRLPADR